MIILRDLQEKDRAAIALWPPYPREFQAQDYALRSGGWISEYCIKPHTRIFSADLGGEVIAFTLLSKTEAASAEFRIALRADQIGKGRGGTIAALSFEKGFTGMGLDLIHLIVRKTNIRAAALYKKLGFSVTGEMIKAVNGKETDFFTMDLCRTGSGLWKAYLEMR